MQGAGAGLRANVDEENNTNVRSTRSLSVRCKQHISGYYSEVAASAIGPCSGVSIPAKGKTVAVTGIPRVEAHALIAWSEVNGDWYSAGTTIYVPSIWLCDANDMQVM